jgi:hypothetical protein
LLSFILLCRLYYWIALLIRKWFIGLVWLTKRTKIVMELAKLIILNKVILIIIINALVTVACTKVVIINFLQIFMMNGESVVIILITINLKLVLIGAWLNDIINELVNWYHFRLSKFILWNWRSPKLDNIFIILIKIFRIISVITWPLPVKPITTLSFDVILLSIFRQVFNYCLMIY